MLRSGAATRVFAALLPLTMAAAFTGVAPALSLRGRGAWRSGTRPLCPLRMALEPAAAMPMDLSLAVTGDGGPEKVSTKEVFGGKRCVIFGVSGAFEPKSTKQLESYMGKLLDLKAGGAELVACVSVNDPYVMKAWAKSEGVGTGNSTIQMLADGDGAFTRALGYMADGDGLLGERSKPFAIVLDEKGVCEFMVQDSEDMDLKVMGHLDFLKGTGAVSKAISSKVAGLASKVRMDSEQAQAAMAAAYDKARQETVELNRVKNDFVAKLEMAGRQATIRLKTMGEMGLASFMASGTNATQDEAQQTLDRLAADRLAEGQKADSLPSEVFLRSAPMNLAKRNALEANRKQWGIGIDPSKPQRVDVKLKWDEPSSTAAPPPPKSAPAASAKAPEQAPEQALAQQSDEMRKDVDMTTGAQAASEASVPSSAQVPAATPVKEDAAPAPAASSAEKRGDCPVCGKPVMSDEPRAKIGGQYLHQACAMSAAALKADNQRRSFRIGTMKQPWDL